MDVLPLLLLMMTLLVEFSRVFDHMVRTANSAFELVSVLSSTPRARAEDSLNARFDRIVRDYWNDEFPGARLLDYPAGSPNLPSRTYSYDSTNRTTTLTFQAKIKPIMRFDFTIPLKVSVTAPYLIPEDPATLGMSQNPSSTYNCCGTIGGGTAGMDASGTGCLRGAALCAACGSTDGLVC